MSFDEMMEKLETMSIMDINAYLHSLGCTYIYDDIHQKLNKAHNELAIAIRESFGFDHYGKIVCCIDELLQGTFDVSGILEQFRKLFKTAKRFHVESLESMVFQVNDGSATITNLGFLLDEMLKKW